jgi:hypothetical protein
MSESMRRPIPDIAGLRAEHKIWPLDQLKRVMVSRALKAAKGNKYLAADLLDVKYRTFRTWTQGIPAIGHQLKRK